MYIAWSIWPRGRPIARTIRPSWTPGEIDPPGKVGVLLARGTLNLIASGEQILAVLNSLSVLAARTNLLAAIGGELTSGLGDQWFTVAGILAPNPLAPQLDTAALVGLRGRTETPGSSSAAPQGDLDIGQDDDLLGQGRDVSCALGRRVR